MSVLRDGCARGWGCKAVSVQGVGVQGVGVQRDGGAKGWVCKAVSVQGFVWCKGCVRRRVCEAMGVQWGGCLMQ